ncbi:hypothetical protein [Burkholderia sp. Tr-20390]|uniref:hypothetical protein n=1 Tax=Burkholderia sp. Tr-20390 TaxID=2703904 RepID=UPI0019810F94|nr:hypothetical protein [Burkholderia sp. Tr-20390]MBN3731727.1 hypothetical protein [Burkholderia sp. Tr-20390]
MELYINYELTDIVSDRYAAGVRRGGLVAQDMIAVQISPPHLMSVVGSSGNSPAGRYLNTRGA